MEKSRINRFVSKYNLAGLVESVKWESKDGSLTTSFISDDKSVLGTVSLSEFDFEDTSFGVYDTSKLTKMLGVLSNDIEFDVTKTEDKAISLKFKDGATSVNYMLADLSVIPSVPDLKQLPDFNITINLDDTFINRFIRAKSALPDENNFTFTCKNNQGSIILGYSNINTNRIKIDVDCTCDGDVDPIAFSANFLKEILVANKEAKDATLKISSDGLAHISFEVDGYKSDYYLVQIQS